MGKRCIICAEEATLKVKDTSEYYCEECAVENFGDVSMLVSIEEDTKKLKAFVEDKSEEITEKDSFEEEEEKDDKLLEE